VSRVIANDVTALQNALRPLHAQVSEIVTLPGQEAQAQRGSGNCRLQPDQTDRSTAGEGRELCPACSTRRGWVLRM
jgi:hypothetical protein